MEFINNVFISDNVDDIGTVIYSLKRHIPVFNIFCICIDFKSKNLFEILSSKELANKRNIKRNLCIAGIAMGKYDSYVLLRDMLQHGEENNWKLHDLKKSVSEC